MTSSKPNSANSKKIAESVLQLSDYFIENPFGETPWSESWAQEAYLNYYHPLNTQRIRYVLDQALQLGFFNGIQNFIDYGAGLGTATLVAMDYIKNNQFPKMEMTLVEKSVNAKNFSAEAFPELQKFSWSTSYHAKSSKREERSAKTSPTVFVFSYSLTELQNLPKEIQNAEALVILEPSTREDGRSLMELRKKLIDHGYFIWAPCVHQGPCPLLTQSKTDWCHHRITTESTNPFLEIEAHLPIKNRTLTFSYLLARKTPPPKEIQNKIRIIGDLLEEKGKTRVAICRNSDREYISWLHKNAPDSDFQNQLQRGKLIKQLPPFQKKGNEIRV